MSSFGMMEWILQDQGAHIKNQLIRELTEQLRIKHHFTTAYSTWANVSVERVCRKVFRACKALLHEFRLGARDWPVVIECVQSELNHDPLNRLGRRDRMVKDVYLTLLEVVTSLKPKRTFLVPVLSAPESVQSLSEAQAHRILNIDAECSRGGVS